MSAETGGRIKILTATGRLALLFAALAPLRAAGEVWEFTVPPSAAKEEEVNADWRQFSSLELDVRLLGPQPRDSLLCTFFFQNKQDMRFESRAELVLNGEPQKFKLSLHELSPDWRCSSDSRTFGADALRWVRTWGVKVFYPGDYAGRLEVGSLRLVTGKPGRLEIHDVELPDSPAAGSLSPVRFRVSGFRGNPFASADFTGHLVVRRGGNRHNVPAYFRQEYVRKKQPGTGAEVVEASGLPFWQANWRPDGEGEHQLALELKVANAWMKKDLGYVPVRSAPEPPIPRESRDVTEAGGNSPPAEFLLRCHAGRLFEYSGGNWTSVPNATASNTLDYWAVPLDWTSKWGNYTGFGEFDQSMAWRFEQELAAFSGKQGGGRMPPVLLFSEDELDDQGTYNWVDHPLNLKNGGTLRRPADAFTDDRERATVLDRARYLWARYGQGREAPGMLILANRPDQPVVDWVNGIAGRLAAQFPEARVVCNSPGLPERWRSRKLELTDAWRTDTRLSKSTRLAVYSERGETEMMLRGRGPGTVAAVLRQVHHLAGTATFSCDIKAPAAPDGCLKVVCLLRTAPDTVFQSRLVSLRGDEWNRVYFNMADPDFWTRFSERDCRLSGYELLSVREIGLVFFYDENRDIELRVRNCALHWPYKMDVEKQPVFVVSDLKGAGKEVRQYGRFELDFRLNRVFNNPYDPKEIDVMLELIDPDGNRIRHPGFFMAPHSLGMTDEKEVATQGGDPSWRVRFRPSKVGKYDWTLTAASRGQNAVVRGSFTCAKGISHGFLRASKRDPRYLELSDGTFFYPIGYNLRSTGDWRHKDAMPRTFANAKWADAQGTGAYAKWFKLMREHGANFARMWICPWWCGLEWSQHSGYDGLGYYNQANAARLDRVLDLAEQEGVYINLETLNHGALSTVIDRDWRDNPLNGLTQPDGPLKYATDFFWSAEAQEAHRNKLRYMIARWGHSTAIAWWGVVTEAEWMEPYYRSMGSFYHQMPPDADWVPRPYWNSAYRQTAIDWIVTTGGYIRKTDAHPHLVSVHFSNPWNGLEVWDKPNMDVVHNNAYTSFANIWQTHRFAGSRGVADVIFTFGQVYDAYSRAKPLLIGEWGGDPVNNVEDDLVTELHTGIWALLMTKTSGVAGYWWWNLVDQDNLYDHYKAVAAFMRGEDRRGKKYQSDRAILTAPDGSQMDRDGLMLWSSEELFAYVYSRAINMPKGSTVPTGFDDRRFMESGDGRLHVPEDIENGKYCVEYWNTFSGQVIGSVEVKLTEKNRFIPLISHRVDLALKVRSAEREDSPRISSAGEKTGGASKTPRVVPASTGGERH